MEIDVKVGLFVSIGVALVLLAILVLGGTNSFMNRQNAYKIHFPSVEGLLVGAKVVVGGLQVGTVKGIQLDPESHSVLVNIGVLRSSSEWIRDDSTVEMATQGVLGDKYLMISTGSADKGVLEPGSEIPVKPSKDFSQLFNKSDQLLISLNGIAVSLDTLLQSFRAGKKSETIFEGLANTAKNLTAVTEKLNKELDGIALKSASRNLNTILDKINNGTGTLGALVNDPSLYEDARSLIGGANRNRIMRNLIRQTIKDSEKDPGTSTAPVPPLAPKK